MHAVLYVWNEGHKHTLLVLPTGTGKTTVFSNVIEEKVNKCSNALALAHIGELFDKAADKLYESSGLESSL